MAFYEKYPSPAKLEGVTVEELDELLFKASGKSNAKDKGKKILEYVESDGYNEIAYQDIRDMAVKSTITLLKTNIKELAEIDLAVADAPSPNTISKYIPKIRKSPSEKQKQSWTTFLKNHRKEIWAMDFFTVPTLYFKVLYVFILISHDRRKIEHFEITTNPSSAWVAQQIREATPFGETPKYLIHDNDATFTSREFKTFLANTNIKSKRTGFKCPWQNGVCERLVGIIRHELLDHIIPINEKHLRYLLKEYIDNYYNPVRTHQGINCQTPILKEKLPETTVAKTVLKSKPILHGLYHDYQKVA